MSSTAPVEFDEGYNKQVIPLPVQLPRLFDYTSIHESRVTVEKLSELYQCMYSFIDGGDQNIVPTKVRLPVLHNFNTYNEEFVTVVTLQTLYKCLYRIDKRTGPAAGATPTATGGAAAGATGYILNFLFPPTRTTITIEYFDVTLIQVHATTLNMCRCGPICLYGLC